MPLTHTHKLNVRYYECDPYGHVNHSNYLRYMQEAAFSASTQAGYGMQAYQELGKFWLIRDTEIDYLKPLVYGDQVSIKTWVSDFRRIRSQRIYEIRANGAEELSAKGQTDWVFLDAKTHRPAKIPVEMMQAFYPEGVPSEAPRRDPFPEPPPAPSGAVTVSRKVTWSDLDPTGHVNNAQYLNFIQEAGMDAAGQFGWSATESMRDGYASVARKTRIEYKQEALMDDEIEITTYISNIRRSSIIRHYLIKRAIDQQIIARAFTKWVYINIQTGRPTRFPEEMMATFADHIA